MGIDRLVLGLLDTSSAIDDSMLATKCRDLTISWSRYGYQGAIIEDESVDGILAEANQQGYRYCLIQSYGHIIQERWTPDSGDFFAALERRIDQQDFLVMGSLMSHPDRWHGLQQGCLLVNLDIYRQLNAPRFAREADGPLELPKPTPVMNDGQSFTLLPSTQVELQRPDLWGWNFVRTSLSSDIPVLGFDDDLAQRTLNLDATCPVRGKAFARCLGDGISSYRRDQSNRRDQSADGLTTDQIEFLDVISRQTANARNGVFLWNIESYADIEVSSHDFHGPVSSLYSVAAGFKPVRILQTHGFDENTRVVYFDYSPNALSVKQHILQEWDGDDFPHFIKHLFKRFPSPETFYQLWDDVTPDTIDWNDVERIWQQECERWGGTTMLRDHWQAYRKLTHEFVRCDLLNDPQPLLHTMTDKERAIIWWSNAFFTMYGNWYFSLEQRQQAYEHWIESLATLNPKLNCLGSDYNNSNVNSIQAGVCWDRYRRSGTSSLMPCRLGETEMRM